MGGAGTAAMGPTRRDTLALPARGPSPSARAARALVLAAVAIATVAALAACPSPASAVRPDDYYGLLGVKRTASTTEIKKAYRKAALELHPDKLGREATEEDEQRFVAIVIAYEVLSDEGKRKRYDVHGPEQQRGAGGGPGGPGGNAQGRSFNFKTYSLFPFDMYVSMPGGAFEFHYTPNSKPKADSIAVQLPLTLEEVYAGVNKTVSVHRHRFCPLCHGRGAEHANGTVPCPVCEATGRHLYTAEDARVKHGYAHVINTTCEYCEGTGHQVVEPCPKCGGHRLIADDSMVNVTVPAGTLDGASITHSGQGNQALGYDDGNLFFGIQHLPHKKFRCDRSGNLVYKTTIPLIDALVGFERNLTLLDGSKLLIRHDVVTFSGYQQTFVGFGMPLPAGKPKDGLAAEIGGTAYGDLIVEFTVGFPRRLSAAQRAILRDLMDEEELAILEDVIRLAAARDADRAAASMGHDEALMCSVCVASDPFLCVLDAPAKQLARIGATEGVRRRARAAHKARLAHEAAAAAAKAADDAAAATAKAEYEARQAELRRQQAQGQQQE